MTPQDSEGQRRDQQLPDQHNQGASASAKDMRAVIAAAHLLMSWSDAVEAAWSAGARRGEALAADIGELLAAEREAGRAEGYAQCAVDVKRAEHALPEYLAAEAAAEAGRWVVRGEVRTRATFGLPHPADYCGGPAAWLPGWAPGAGASPLRGAA